MVPFSCTARGVKVSGWRTGGEGPRVLSTHGWLDNANTWKPVASALSSMDWASFDFPGHGRSGHVARGETYHFVEIGRASCRKRAKSAAAHGSREYRL